MSESARSPFTTTIRLKLRVPARLRNLELVLVIFAICINLASIALQGIRKARIELGEPVAVIGAGLIGLMALQLARLQGALPAISIDQDEGRLDFAAKSGADILLVANQEIGQQLAKELGGDGAAVVIEATGHPDAILSALACARPLAALSC